MLPIVKHNDSLWVTYVIVALFDKTLHIMKRQHHQATSWNIYTTVSETHVNVQV
jgi:hypothetical protein